MNNSLLEVKELTKHYHIGGSFWGRGQKIIKAVEDVSFSVGYNNTLGIVGESGCGKSTIARLITRIIQPTGGKIYFNGAEVLALNKASDLQMRKAIQFIFQDPYSSLNPRKRIIQIVGRPMAIHNGVRKASTIREKVAELLEQVGLKGEYVDRYPHEFSGGQRQRISIARALACGPELLIADEPVSALDVSVQAGVLNLFKRLQAKTQLSIIFISHNLNVVEYLCDNIVVMYAGKIVEVGTREDIFAAPLHPYTRMLFASSPEPDPTAARPDITIVGEPPSPFNRPKGCYFRPRCGEINPLCTETMPALREYQHNHQVACHLFQ